MKLNQTYYPVMEQVGLFQGIRSADFPAMLDCVGGEILTAERDEIVLLAGDRPEHVGVVLEGQLHIIKENLEGDVTLVAPLGAGEIYAEALCCAGVEGSPVTVVAQSKCVILRINFVRILDTCPGGCPFHSALIRNMLGMMARKNLYLQSRMELVRIKSVRQKVMHYLDGLTPAGERNVVVPLNREGMAEYLCVERSALSHELMKMRKEGLLDYQKNKFTIRWR